MKMRCWGAALLVPIVVACGTDEVEEEESLQTWTVISGDMRLTAEATGNVEPIRAVEVTSKASGEVTRLYVDVGNEVEPGALLAEVDPRDVRNAFDQSQADLQVAQARAEISQAQLTRSEELLESGVISDQEHESRALDFANSRASVVRAETNFELAQLRLDDVIIRAPLAGTILEKNVEEGQVIQSASQNVSGGTTLVIMADLKFMQVRTLVDETDMGDIRAGMPATVTVEAYPQERFMGIVEKIEPQALVQQNVTMFPVIVQLDNDSGLLRPGRNAEAEIELAQESGVLLVPNNAVVTPEDVQPASVVLGLDTATIDTSNLFAGLGDGRGRPTADQTSAREGGRSGGRQGGATRGTGGGRGGAAFDSMRALMASGISQDSALVLLPEIANLFSGRRGGGGGGGRGGFSGQGAVEQVGQAEPGEGTSGRQRETSRAVVFVVAADGTTIEPRGVIIGLNDFDFTEVVSGLEEGDLLAIIGAADLRASRDAARNRGRPDFGGGRGGFR